MAPLAVPPHPHAQRKLRAPLTPPLAERHLSASDPNRGNLGDMQTKGTTVVKTMKPGDPGTRRQLERWGNDLLCVRYRYDEERHERMTTVEIVVERGVRAPRVDPDHKVGVRRRYEETDLRHRVREAGSSGTRCESSGG